jgi:endoglucanase
VYGELLRSAARMLYLQRCGVETGAALAGPYAHPACHTALATIYPDGGKIDVAGGWHDAGDYGRYVVTGAKAAADLMLAHELRGSALDDVGIPESGDGLDDLLEEAKFELDWLLKMQAASGGVYHKVTCAGFPGFGQPERETAELIVCPVPNTATGDFAYQRPDGIIVCPLAALKP